METFTFYSYKGGVGRSVAVSHIAEQLAELNQKIFLIDFDLEAPGLHYKFKKEIAKTRHDKPEKKGLIDYLFNFLIENEKIKLPTSFEDYFYDLSLNSDSNEGKIYLMTAGNFSQSNYWHKLSEIDWKKDFLTGQRIGVKLLLDLKARIQKEVNPDYLIIDSRTGISAISTLTLKVLADKIVLVAVNNEENLEGSITILEALKLKENQWNNRSKEVFFALSRLPFPITKEETAKEEKIVQIIRNRITSSLVKKENFLLLHEDRELIWEEKKINQLSGSVHLPIKEDYFQLLSILTRNSNHGDLIIKIQEQERVKGAFADALDLFKKDKKSEEALAILRQATSKYPNYYPLYSLAANIYYKQENYPDSIKASTKSLELDPNNYAEYNNRGLAFMNNGQLVQAIKDLTKSIQLNSTDFKAFLNRALAYSKNRQYRKSLPDLAKAIELNPNDAYAYELRASNLISINNFTASIKDSERAIEISNDKSRGYYLISQAYYKQKKYKLATNYISKAIKSDPSIDEYYYTRAVIAATRKSSRIAINDFNRALSLNPNNYDAYLARGYMFFFQEEYKKAIDDFSKYLKKESGYKGYMARAKAYEKLKKYELALNDYNIAIKKNKKHYELYFRRAVVHTNLRKYKLAVKDYTQVIKNDSKDIDAYYNRGSVYKFTKKYEFALRDFNRLLVLRPNDFKTLLSKAEIYELKGEFGNAIKELNLAIKLKPTNANLYNERANNYVKMHLYKRALEDARKCIKLDNKHGYAHSTIAEVYAFKGKNVLFYKHLKKAILFGFPLKEHVNDLPYKNFKKDPPFVKLISGKENF